MKTVQLIQECKSRSGEISEASRNASANRLTAAYYGENGGVVITHIRPNSSTRKAEIIFGWRFITEEQVLIELNRLEEATIEHEAFMKMQYEQERGQ